MAISATRGGSSPKALTLPLPSPKAPPGYPDLYGKRREMSRVQMLEREISFLEEELKSSEGLQPASKCCKEIDEFVMAKPDPLLPTKKKNRRSRRFWKWLCSMPCFNLSWICCCCCWCCDGCSQHLKLPSCSSSCCSSFFRPCCCSCFRSCSCCTCPKPKCRCCCTGGDQKSSCCRKGSCGCKNCCIPPSCNVLCPCFSCCSCKCSCSCTCPKVQPTCCCTKSCWNPCCC